MCECNSRKRGKPWAIVISVSPVSQNEKSRSVLLQGSGTSQHTHYPEQAFDRSHVPSGLFEWPFSPSVRQYQVLSRTTFQSANKARTAFQVPLFNAAPRLQSPTISSAVSSRVYAVEVAPEVGGIVVITWSYCSLRIMSSSMSVAVTCPRVNRVVFFTVKLNKGVLPTTTTSKWPFDV